MTPNERETDAWIESGAGPRLHARHARGPRAAAVVAPPHPEMGGRMHHPVVDAMVAGLGAAGVATLRYDWRGAGQSTGALTGDPLAARADYAAALAHLAGMHDGPYLAAGYSFGAATALAVGADDARVSRMLLVGPPAGLLRAEFLDAFTGDILVIVGDDDSYAPVPRVRAILALYPRVRLEVVPGADHFFATGGLERIAPLVTAFAG
jgi:hypothetical protein